MELQWPLIIFTTLTAWSAGLFATQAAYALKGHGGKAQLPAWITSAVLLAAGGIAVFFHLQHWERIFNGFGHLTSGITQELIAIAVLAVVAVIYLVFLRKSDDGGSVPAWIAGLAIAMSAVLVAVMAHSYMMHSRPAWNNILWITYVLGNACAFGPATMALISFAVSKAELPKAGSMLVLAGAAVNAVTTVAYAMSMQLSGSAYTKVDWWFDPTNPMREMVDPIANVNVFAGDQALIMWVCVILVGAVAPVVLALLAKKRSANVNWTIFGTIIATAVLIGAIGMRVVFYNLGVSVFMFY